VNRRGFLAVAAASLGAGRMLAGPAVQDTARSRGPGDPLQQPELAGQPRAAVRPVDNDERVKTLEGRLKCTCGCNLDVFTCRTTDFSCTYSPALHREVVAQFEAGKAPEAIVQSFVARYGESILMAPKPAGFNLLGYLVPGALVLLAGGALTLVLLRRGRVVSSPASASSSTPSSSLSASTTGSAPSAPSPAPSPEELAHLREALHEID